MVVKQFLVYITGHSMTTVEDQLETARKNLLDMSLRNKLLNFKEYKRSTAKVVDEVPSQIYGRLVLDENSMSFLPSEEHPEHQELEVLDEGEAVIIQEEGKFLCQVCDESRTGFTSQNGFLDHLESHHDATVQSDEFDGHTPEAMAGLWDLPELGGLEVDRHTDRHLQTPHPESDLQKRLYNISKRAQALIEDAGYNALHLAIGFLEWTEADAQAETNRAPLLLVPVSLDRQSAQSRFNVRWNQEEVTGNLSLELKLSEQGFELPEFDQPSEAGGIRDYLEDVEKAVEDWDQWDVTPDIHLGFFDFTKFIMYQDLNPDAWEAGNSPADHHLLQTLLDPDVSADEPPPFDEELIDEELAPTDVHHVKDADPSQIAAIEDVKRERNLVIEGPPGTGKSQTIVNLIAELVAEDKTVLFVSEKLAALDVVKDRLDSVRIGEFCLELHSDKASKSDFLDELERIVRLDSYDPDFPRETFDQLSQRNRELNAYADALRTPFGALEISPFDLYGQREEVRQHFKDKDRTLLRVDIENPKSITPEENQAALSSLQQFSKRVELAAPVPQHPWFGCSPGDVLPQSRHDAERRLEDLLESLSELREASSRLQDECAVDPDQTVTGVTTAIEAAKILKDSEPVDAEVLQNSSWNKKPPRAEDLIQRVARTQELASDVGERTDPAHVDPDVTALLTDYRKLHDSVTRFLRPSWYKLGSHLSALYGGETSEESAAIIQDLEDLIELEQNRTALEDAQSTGRDLFGSLWQGEKTDPDQLRRFSEWVVEFRGHLLEDMYQDRSVEMVTRGVAESRLGRTIDRAQDRLETFEQQLESLVDMVGLDGRRVFGDPIKEVSFEAIEEQLQTYRSEIDRLERWGRFDVTREEVRETPAAPIVDRVEAGDIPPDDIGPCYRGNLADALLAEAFAERDVLKRFDGQVFEDRIEDFRELDRKSLEINQKRVLSRLVERTPELMEGASKSSPAGTLFHEFGKERRHKPIRVLLQDAGDLIQQMKPCFMMSPLSVAKYLEPDGIDFDVVIFDEASQVKPEDALGAILRGNQVVMLGDTKQLPPTSFFDQIVDQRESEDQWAFSIQDVESILDLCRSSFPMKRLRWHYRSRHESLIAVSNQEFYNNDLLIYPSPIQDADELGLQLNHLPETVYDRGGSSVNREEAKAVAQAAVDHYTVHPEKSLGVGHSARPSRQRFRKSSSVCVRRPPRWTSISRVVVRRTSSSRTWNGSRAMSGTLSSSVSAMATIRTGRSATISDLSTIAAAGAGSTC